MEVLGVLLVGAAYATIAIKWWWHRQPESKSEDESKPVTSPKRIKTTIVDPDGVKLTIEKDDDPWS